MLKFGDTLKNGAQVIRYRERSDASGTRRFVFAYVGRHADGTNEFATWQMDEEANTFYGHYFFNDFEAAQHDWLGR